MNNFVWVAKTLFRISGALQAYFSSFKFKDSTNADTTLKYAYTVQTA